MLTPYYDPVLVVVSVLVAVLASYVALDLTGRVNAARHLSLPRWQQVAWGLGGAMAMASGIWSMHFVGMMALQLPVPIRYQVSWLILSFMPALAASALALFVASRSTVSRLAHVTGGGFMGVGIAAMHYVGMAAIASPTGLHYHAALWWLSVAIAVLASWAALALAFALRESERLWLPRRAVAAMVMGAAISGMHYTGMAAAQFPAPSDGGAVASAPGVLATRGLAVGVTLSACSILGIALMSAALANRIRRYEETQQRRTEQVLRRAAEALAVTGPEFYPRALQELLRVLQSEFGMIAHVDGAAATHAETIVAYKHGAVVPNFSFKLEGKPCEHVKRDPGIWCCPEGLAERFPLPWIVELQATGYIGIPIVSSDQTLLGFIAVLTRHPLRDRAQAEALLQIFSTRVAGEMQLARTDAALRASGHRLFQLEKFDAIGRLAGGVAHDFNNMLTVILGFGQELQGRLPDGDAVAVNEIVAAAERAKQLTQQLLAFSRRQRLEPKPISLNAILLDLESMLRRIVGEDVVLVTRAQATADVVLADPAQLQQVILNLVVNARDAMPSGGTLRIDTALVMLDIGTLVTPQLLRGIPPGRYVLLTVSDTGEGMSDTTLMHIFEPFFSTKGSQGTGLGLATVYGIVHQSGAFIGCTSAVGTGTTFQIYFPAVDDPIEPAIARPHAAPGVERGHTRVLVVEDERAVRAMIVEGLQKRGYDVSAAGSAREALDTMKAGYVPDVLLTDLVMPGGMNGYDLAAAAAALHPGLRTLLMSGYANHAVLAGEASTSFGFLQKPFTPDTLHARLREVLEDV